MTLQDIINTAHAKFDSWITSQSITLDKEDYIQTCMRDSFLEGYLKSYLEAFETFAKSADPTLIEEIRVYLKNINSRN